MAAQIDPIKKAELHELLFELQSCRLNFQRVCEPTLIGGLDITEDALTSYVQLATSIQKIRGLLDFLPITSSQEGKVFG